MGSAPWWAGNGDERCPGCLQWYARQVEVRCVACDAPSCPFCYAEVCESRERFCLDCAPANARVPGA